MHNYLSYAILCFTSFITIVNPLSTLPVFLTMTANYNKEQRKAVATKAVISAFVAMLVFAFAGEFIFKFFQITANGLRIVGGIIFFRMGSEMLTAKMSAGSEISKKEIKEYDTDISLTPLAIPMICGPGAITNAILFMEQSHTIAHKLIVVGVMLAVSLIMLIALRGGATFARFLGDSGMKVMMRIMGLILMVIAVEFFFAGLTPIIQDIFHLKP